MARFVDFSISGGDGLAWESAWDSLAYAIEHTPADAWPIYVRTSGEDFQTIQPPVRIRSVTPAWAAPAGGTVIDIVGGPFGAAAGTVLIDNVSAVVDTWTDVRVRIRAPALAAGAYPVTVVTADGRSDTLLNAVAYRDTTSGPTAFDLVEAAILQRLRDTGLQASSFAISDLDDEDRFKLMKLPAVNVAVQSAEFTKETTANMAACYRLRMNLVVSIAVRNLGGEAKQRAAAYGLLFGVLHSLMEKRLSYGSPAGDIGVKPLAPSGMRLAYYSTTVEVWQFTFRTDMTVEPRDDETAQDFLRIGMEYYLNEPEDSIVDAQDLVNMELS